MSEKGVDEVKWLSEGASGDAMADALTVGSRREGCRG